MYVWPLHGHSGHTYLWHEKVPGDSVLRMIRYFSKHNDTEKSTNGWIDSDKFPTTYFTASWVTHFMSHFLHHFMVPLAPYLVFLTPTQFFLKFPHGLPCIYAFFA